MSHLDGFLQYNVTCTNLRLEWYRTYKVELCLYEYLRSLIDPWLREYSVSVFVRNCSIFLTPQTHGNLSKIHNELKSHKIAFTNKLFWVIGTNDESSWNGLYERIHCAKRRPSSISLILSQSFKIWISLCSYENSNQVIITQFCTWHGNFAVMTYAKKMLQLVISGWKYNNVTFPLNLIWITVEI